MVTEQWTPPEEANPIDVYVGACIRWRRMMMDASQEELAAGIGVTFQQIQKYERGTNRISASRLHRVAKYLGVDVAFFFQDIEIFLHNPPLLNDFVSMVSERERVLLIKAFRNISNPRMRTRILALVETAATG